MKLYIPILVLAVLLVLAFVSPSLATPEDSITPLEQYNTAKAKALASTYKPQLLRFYESGLDGYTYLEEP